MKLQYLTLLCAMLGFAYAQSPDGFPNYYNLNAAAAIYSDAAYCTPD